MNSPRKPREERELELRRMIMTEEGSMAVVNLIRKYEGLPEGTFPGPGTPLVATVLAHEYPPEKS